MGQERGRAEGGPAAKAEKSTKGRKGRWVPLGERFAGRLAAWYEESVIAGGADAKGYVWPGIAGGPMGERTLPRCWCAPSTAWG